MIFIVGGKRYALQEASAYCMLSTMAYYAQLKGLGTCLWANGPMVIRRSRQTRSRLGIRRGECAYGAMLVGHPALRFRNKVEGRRIDVQWNGMVDSDE